MTPSTWSASVALLVLLASGVLGACDPGITRGEAVALCDDIDGIGDCLDDEEHDACVETHLECGEDAVVEGACPPSITCPD